MNAEHWKHVDRVLNTALERDPADWPGVLDESCGNDKALHRDVQALLNRYASAQRFLTTPPALAAAALISEARADDVAESIEGRRIGTWRIVRQIGRGGMARVFLAERADGEFSQSVALKLLRPGLDSEVDQARARSERQILASLDHPSIARLLDGGVTDEGLPYLALEYVEGEPIDHYCDARRLSIRQRLELFLAVADAIQYAHRNLVVHRDLKPSNIHVSAQGRVKLLDFGLAKLLEPEGERALGATTRTGHRWMTPEYAAPEQVTGGAITTVTDVYQLGVVLHELLTGQLPFASRTNLHDLESAVLREEPAAPSRLRRELRGDLDAIVLKALRKEPDQRYASAHEMAEDVRRHLVGAPVVARGDATGYRLRRYVLRHRRTFAVAAGIVILLGAYAVTVTVQARRIRLALDEVRTEALKSEQVTDFMLGLFEANDPGASRGNRVTANELMARGAARAQALAGQPAIQAQMLDVVGRIRTQLGAYDDARPGLEQALTTRRRLFGESHPDVAASYASLGELSGAMGDYPAATSHFRRALEIRRASLGPSHPKALEVLFSLANALHEGGDHGGARLLFDEWIAARSGRAREFSAVEADQLTTLAGLLQYSGQPARAEQLHRDALAIRRALYGERHPDVANSLNQLAAAFDSRGSVDSAVQIARQSIAIYRSVYPDGHPDLAMTMATLAISLRRGRHFDEAERVLREALSMNRRFLGDEHLWVGMVVAQLAAVMRAKGAYADAEPLYRDVVKRNSAMMGANNVLVLQHRLALGEVLLERGSYAEAESLLLSSYAALRDRRGRNPEPTRTALRALIRLYEAQARASDASRYRVLLEAQ